MTQSQTPRPAGKKFGKYELIERIGSGGMAEVYLARSFGAEGLEKQLVIKKILPAFATKERFISMFIDEAKIAVSLNHPNIVQVYDFGRVKDDYFLAMEYVDGWDLARLMARLDQATFPLGEALFLATELCKGLDYAHRRTDQYGEPLSLVHRDISPQNLLVSRDGNLKIVDFGIAHARTVSADTVGLIKGKYSYMSPEQAAGVPVDHRSDLFSALVVLFEMLYGRPLFKFTTSDETLSRVRSAVIPVLATLTPAIPEPLERVLYKGLQRDPAQRYQTARELQIDLHKVLLATGELHDSLTVAGFAKDLDDRAPVRPASQDAETVLHGQEARTPPIPLTISSPSGTEVTPAGHHLPGEPGEPGEPAVTGEIRRTKKDFVCVSGEVTGFAELRARTTADRWQSLLLELMRIIEAIAFKNKAIVERFNENGFLILLGLPASSENDAERAVWMSLDLLEAVAGINLNLETPIHVSVGIALGRALLQQNVTRRGYEKTLLGRVVDLSHRMAQEAMPREILVGGKIYQRIRRSFELAFLKQIPFEEDERYGLSNPSLYRVLWPKGRIERQAELRQSYSVLHGRDLELKALRERFHRVQVERACLGLALKGENGVGKSALVDEFLSGVEAMSAQLAGPQPGALDEGWAEPPRILRALPTRYQLDTPYAVIRDLVHDLLRLEAEDDIRAIKAAIEAAVSRQFPGAEPAERLYLTHALGFFFDVKYSNSVLDALSAAQRRSRLLLSVKRLLEAYARQAPTVAVVEDLQHCDSASLEFLCELLDGTLTGPVFIIMTLRPQEQPPLIQRLLSLSRVEVEEVQELSRRHATAVVRERLGDFPIDRVALDYILDRSGGVPFFISEIVDALRSRKVLKVVNGTYTLGGAANETWLPTSLEAVVAARIDGLDPNLKATLRVCSILGAEFERRDAEFLFGRDIIGPLEELERLRWLLRARTSATAYRFAHTLTFEVAFRELLWEERTDYHARLADHLIAESQAGRRQADLATIARHLEGAGRNTLASEFYYRAAHRALSDSSHVEALRMVNRALKLAPAESRYAALMLKETVLAALSNHEERLATLVEAQRTAERFHETRELLHVLNRQARYWFDQREFERALPLLDQVSLQALEGSYLEQLAQGRQTTAMIMRETGSAEEAIALLGEALMGFHAVDDHQSAAYVLKNIGDTYWQMGRFHDALDAYGEALQGGEAFPRDLSDVVAVNMGLVYVSLGDYEAGLERYREALKSCRAIGFQRREAAILPNLGHLYLLLGDPVRAERTLLRAVRLARRIRDNLVLADALLTLAVVYLDRGNLPKADEMFRRGYRTAQDTEINYLLIHAELGLARLHLLTAERDDELEDAERFARAAIEHGDSASMVHGLAHGNHLLALVLQRQGRHAEALAAGRAALEQLEHQEIVDQEAILFEQAALVRACAPEDAARAEALIARAARHVDGIAQKFTDDERRARYLARPSIRAIVDANCAPH